MLFGDSIWQFLLGVMLPNFMLEFWVMLAN